MATSTLNNARGATAGKRKRKEILTSRITKGVKITFILSIYTYILNFSIEAIKCFFFKAKLSAVIYKGLGLITTLTEEI